MALQAIHDYMSVKLSEMNLNPSKNINTLIFDVFCYWRKVWKIIAWGSYQRLTFFVGDDNFYFTKIILKSEEEFEYILSRKMKKCTSEIEETNTSNKLWSSNNELYQLSSFYANHLVEYKGLINKPYLDFLYSEPKVNPTDAYVYELMSKESYDDDNMIGEIVNKELEKIKCNKNKEIKNEESLEEVKFIHNCPTPMMDVYNICDEYDKLLTNYLFIN